MRPVLVRLAALSAAAALNPAEAVARSAARRPRAAAPLRSSIYDFPTEAESDPSRGDRTTDMAADQMRTVRAMLNNGPPFPSLLELEAAVERGDTLDDGMGTRIFSVLVDQVRPPLLLLRLLLLH